MQLLLCAAGTAWLALGAAAGLCRWYVGVAVWLVCGAVQRRSQHSATTGYRALPVCEWPTLGMPWGTARSNAASAMCSRVGGACTGGPAAGPGRWFVGVAVLPVCGAVQRRSQHSATTAHRALLVCECQPWACHGALQGQMQPLQCAAGVVEPAVGVAARLARRFLGLWVCRCVEISRGGGSTHQPHRTEHCQCGSVQPWACHGALQGQMQALLCVAGAVGLHWGLRQGRAGGLWGLRFCRFVEISRGGGSTRQPQHTEPCQCVSGQPWACHGALQGQMQTLLQ